MHAAPGSHELKRFLVELVAPDLGWQDIQALGRRSRTAAGELRRLGSPVRFLRSVFVPEDGTCFLLYEALSAEAVGEAAARAELGVVQVVRAMQFEGATQR